MVGDGPENEQAEMNACGVIEQQRGVLVRLKKNKGPACSPIGHPTQQGGRVGRQWGGWGQDWGEGGYHHLKSLPGLNLDWTVKIIWHRWMLEGTGNFESGVQLTFSAVLTADIYGQTW